MKKDILIAALTSALFTSLALAATTYQMLDNAGNLILSKTADGISIVAGADEFVGLEKVGALGTDESFGYVLTQDGVVVGFMATYNDGAEQSFYLGESTDFTDAGISFRGSGAGAFAGDIDIESADAAGSAVHLAAPSHVHIQGELYVGGVVDVANTVHGGSNGKTNYLVCIKSDGNFGNMAQSGGNITTGTCS